MSELLIRPTRFGHNQIEDGHREQLLSLVPDELGRSRVRIDAQAFSVDDDAASPALSNRARYLASAEAPSLSSLNGSIGAAGGAFSIDHSWAVHPFLPFLQQRRPDLAQDCRGYFLTLQESKPENLARTFRRSGCRRIEGFLRKFDGQTDSHSAKLTRCDSCHL